MCDVLLLIYEACTNINNYLPFIKGLSCAQPCVKHLTNSFNPEENSVGIIMSIL